jgi:hypothetical protein
MMAIVFMLGPLRVFAFENLRANTQTINEIYGASVAFLKVRKVAAVADFTFSG